MRGFRRALTAIIGPERGRQIHLAEGQRSGSCPAVGRRSRSLASRLPQARERVAYVPQRASVDWDFPTRVLDVVHDGPTAELGCGGGCRAPHAGRRVDCSGRGSAWTALPTARSGSFRAGSNSGVFWRAPGAGGRAVPAGRALRGRRRGHRTRHHRRAARTCGAAGKSGLRASRPVHGARVFRPRLLVNVRARSPRVRSPTPSPMRPARPPMAAGGTARHGRSDDR